MCNCEQKVELLDQEGRTSTNITTTEGKIWCLLVMMESALVNNVTSADTVFQKTLLST